MLSFLRRYSFIVGCLCIILTVICLAGAETTAHTAAFLGTFGAAVLFWLLSLTRFAYRLRPYRRTVTVSAVCILLAILSCYYIIARPAAALRSLTSSQETHRITGYTTEAGSDGTYGSTKVTVTQLDGKEYEFDLLLLRTNTPAPTPYRYFTAEITFESESSSLKHHRDENILISANLIFLTPTDDSVQTIGSFFHRLSSGLSTVLHRNLDSKTASFACALLLGQRNGLDDEINRDFRFLGISHTLAVSGLHLSVLTAALLFLLGILRAGRKTRLTVITLFLALFVGICGFSPSVLRAALMAACLLVANTAGEKTNGLRTLAISLGLILLFCPYLIFSVSLQLSALATLGILVLYPLFIGKESPKHTLWLGGRVFRFFLCQCALTVAATVFTLPILYLQFGAVSLASLFANLLFVPLVTLMLYLLAVYLILLPIPGIHHLLRYAVSGLYTCIRELAGMARHCKDLYCYLPLWVIVTIAIVVSAAFLLYLLKRTRLAPLSLLLAVLSLFLCYPVSLTGSEQLLYRCDSNGDTLLLTQGNEVILIETGNASRKNAALALEEALHTLHQTGIDTLILTHYHPSSHSFLTYLCENTYLETLYLPAPTSETERANEKQLRGLAKEMNVTAVTYDCEQLLAVSGFSLRIHTEYLFRSEHPSQAIEIVSKGGRVLAADPSVFELDGIGAPDLSGVDHLILIDSPPADKYPLPSFDGEETVHAFYSSNKQYEIIGCPFGDHTVLSEDCPRIMIVFEDPS
ncbi:MAG: hypothetical protein E7599_00185 [Ruminococcaceae bacterium]|nr:hypothetical protein [Oscillospiraceae bacterium]